MSKYTDLVAEKAATIKQGGAPWAAINPEYAARMELQNRFKTGLDIARYTAGIMRKDMATAANTPNHWGAGTVSPRNK